MQLIFNTQQLTQEQRKNFEDVCLINVKGDINIEVRNVIGDEIGKSGYLFVEIAPSNKAVVKGFVMSVHDFDFISYAYEKMLQLTADLLNIISQME